MTLKEKMTSYMRSHGLTPADVPQVLVTFAAYKWVTWGGIVLLGYTVLHTDCDVVFLRDPAPYIMCPENDAATAAAIAESVDRPGGPANSDDDVPDISQFDSEHCHSYLHYFETGHAYALEV